MTSNADNSDPRKMLGDIIANTAERFQSESGIQVSPEAQAYLLNTVGDRAHEITRHPREQLVTALLSTFAQAGGEPRLLGVSPTAAGGDTTQALNIITARALATFDWPWPFSRK
jgi:hypothetical protein